MTPEKSSSPAFDAASCCLRKLCSLCCELCNKLPLGERTRRVTSLIFCRVLRECRSCFRIERRANAGRSTLKSKSGWGEKFKNGGGRRRKSFQLKVQETCFHLKETWFSLDET